ncbi:MAG: cupin domain-containing protein [Thermomicrobiales bacterium]|nr:cupin domain-containing protein [Thermomicrobiales bacterium]
MNVIVLRPYEGIPAHINQTLDVVVTCLQGTGVLTIDEEPIAIEAGSIALIPRGASARSLRMMRRSSTPPSIANATA